MTLDQTAPSSRPTFSSPWATGSSPAWKVVTSVPTFSGTADPDAQVMVMSAEDPDGYPANVTPNEAICFTTADSEGMWTCGGVEGLTPGHSYSIGAQQTDQAHNQGPLAIPAFELSLDIPPQAPSIATPLADAGSQWRSGEQVTFSGATAPNTTVKVSEGGSVLCQSFSSAGTGRAPSPR